MDNSLSCLASKSASCGIKISTNLECQLSQLRANCISSLVPRHHGCKHLKHAVDVARMSSTCGTKRNVLQSAPPVPIANALTMGCCSAVGDSDWAKRSSSMLEKTRNNYLKAIRRFFEYTRFTTSALWQMTNGPRLSESVALRTLSSVLIQGTRCMTGVGFMVKMVGLGS